MYSFLSFLVLLMPQQTTVQEFLIGQVPIRLGMSMNEVAQKFHDPFYLDEAKQPFKDSIVWWVREKHGDSYFFIGKIQFS